MTQAAPPIAYTAQARQVHGGWRGVVMRQDGLRCWESLGRYGSAATAKAQATIQQRELARFWITHGYCSAERRLVQDKLRTQQLVTVEAYRQAVLDATGRGFDARCDDEPISAIQSKPDTEAHFVAWRAGWMAADELARSGHTLKP